MICIYVNNDYIVGKHFLHLCDESVKLMLSYDITKRNCNRHVLLMLYVRVVCLQRQSVPFVCQIFHDKTVTALSTVKDKLGLSEGTIIFVKLITDWFHMMNVKDRYSGINMRHECRQPWTKNSRWCKKKLAETCDVISSCAWSGGRGRTQKLTKQIAEALVLSTRANIEAAEWLLTQHNFTYVLSGVFVDEALEKFFGQPRQRNGGNFYIDIVDIKAAAETKNLHALLKYESSRTSLIMCLVPLTFALMIITLTSLLLTLKT